MIRVISALLLFVLLAGCAAKEDHAGPPAATEPVTAAEAATESPTEATSPETAPTESGTASIPAPPAELLDPATVTIYEYAAFSGIFTPYEAPASGNGGTLLNVVDTVREQLGVSIPVRSITQQKGMVVIDLEESFLDEYNKSEMVWILVTLGVTLRENHRSFEWIQYQVGGEIGVFGERFDLPPLKLVEGDPEEFAAIRATIPYQGMEEVLGVRGGYPIVETDETGVRLAEYLSVIDLAGISIASADELDNEHIISTAVNATKHYTTVPDNNYRPELKPFEAPAEELLGFREEWFWLQEHVEETIRLLYGDVSFKHQSFMGNKYRYLELLGVYTPPHMGGAGRMIPVIFGYEETEDQIVAEVAYVTSGMGSYVYHTPEGEWIDIPEDEISEFARTKAARYTVTVHKQPNGSFLIESQVPVTDA